MKTSSAIAIATVGGAIAYQFLPKETRARIAHRVEEGMAGRMEHAMKAMPADAPPKLVKRVMPKLEKQNEEILKLLREQNALLKQAQLGELEREPEPVE